MPRSGQKQEDTVSKLAELQLQKQETEELNKLISALEDQVAMLTSQNATLLQRLSIRTEDCRRMADWITKTDRFHIWVIDAEWNENDEGDVRIALRFIDKEGD